MLLVHPSPATPTFAFSRHDEVVINGIPYRPYDRTEKGYTFVRLDREGVPQSFSKLEMAQLVDAGEVEHRRGALLPEAAKARLETSVEEIWARSDEEHRRAKLREAVVLAFFDMERNREVKRTDGSIKAKLSDLKIAAGKILSVPCAADDRPAANDVSLIPKKISPRSIRRWIKDYENLQLAGLYDKAKQRGGGRHQMEVDALALMSSVVLRYISDQKPSKENIYEDVLRAFKEENAKRAEQREKNNAPCPVNLRAPSRETVRRAINNLDPFHCTLVRDGLEEAQRQFRPVGRGVELTRPLQRIEMDAWTVDLMTIMATSGLMPFLSEEDKVRLGLDKGKGRWLLTVAICATTRCIVGMRLSRTATTASALATVEDITRDKGVWADAVGAMSPWHQSGTPELLVMDCAKSFVSYDLRLACQSIGVRVEHAPAGIAYLRPYIERLFGTVATHLMPRLTGRTFGDIIEKGDYDAEARAALTADDLCAALIRWAVDIYHRLPHGGLDGEAPIDCWNRLVSRWGVSPAPDLRRRRIAFGTKLTRTVSQTGIKVQGIRYHEKFLGLWFKDAKDPAVNVRWYNEDLGAIEVQLNGEWRTVRSVDPRFKGVRAQAYMAAARELRAFHKARAEINADIVLEAIAALEKINGDAMDRIALLVDDWPAERVATYEDDLFLGFCVGDDAPDVAPAASGAFIGEAVPTGTSPVTTVPAPETLLPTSEPNAAVKTKESPSQGKTSPSKQKPDDAGWGLAEK